MDATVTKLLKRWQELQQEIGLRKRELNAITMALSVAGIRPPETSPNFVSSDEVKYHYDKPLSKLGLREACLQVLRDQGKHWLSKSQVEYLVTLGGYPFKTKDSKNSVGVTLRRLAEDGVVEAQREKGSRGNKYKYQKPHE